MCVDNIYLRIYCITFLLRLTRTTTAMMTRQTSSRPMEVAEARRELRIMLAPAAAQSLDTEQYEDLALIKWVWIVKQSG